MNVCVSKHCEQCTWFNSTTQSRAIPRSQSPSGLASQAPSLAQPCRRSSMCAFIPSLPTQCFSHARSKQAKVQVVCKTSAHASSVSRRRAVQLLALLSASYLPTSSRAATETGGREEVNEDYGYRFMTPPANWTRSTGSLSTFRTATVFLNSDDSDTNISVVVTPVPGDYQKLTSFGSLDTILKTIVPKKGKDIEGEVISTRTDTGKNAYVIEYSITSKGEQRHLLTVFSLQPGRHLVTLTGQAKEENWAGRESEIRNVLESYKIDLLE